MEKLKPVWVGQIFRFALYIVPTVVAYKNEKDAVLLQASFGDSG